MGVEIHSHNLIKSLMGLLSANRLFSLLFYKPVLGKTNAYPYEKSKLVAVLCVFLAIAAVCECTTEQDQPATQQKQFNALGQRLVRRNFLRFGKRSGSGGPSEGDDDFDGYWNTATFGNNKLEKRSDKPAPTGPGELYEAMLMGKQPHSTSARSFLRFGKRGLYPTQSMMTGPGVPSKRRADNFLRFGKSIDDDHKAEEMLGRWKKFLLVMLAKVAEEEDDMLHNRQVLDKKSSDFLRFG